MTIRSLGRQDYEPLWRAMQALTNVRSAATADEIWFTEHPPVFTLGLNASREHLLAPGDIPVVQIDRGGQVTYHGPGQMMIYPLLDIRRAGIGVRPLVTALERAVIRLAADFSIVAECRANAPGVYVGEKKLASVGLRIRRGASYHGMALNIEADLEPFSRINPCGYQGLELVNLRELGVTTPYAELESRLLQHLLAQLDLSDRQLNYVPSLPTS
ncbi:lipoyl(octanoyl) transferase LipB [Woeseia oceani]|uniref:Octanoyltransferase n=1 Tax=Woeseia oceani TaxID=1548547 RepID=A0A193LL47_9GAMM|nr:lipoyl(octanoyl) transferase LipB [Woeseia oceani]ANO53212.1 octanoyltransferase [Woeseia oceani]